MKEVRPRHLAYLATDYRTSSLAVSPLRTPWSPGHPKATGNLDLDFQDQSKEKGFQRCEVGVVGRVCCSVQ